jgi:phosphogluconate dehydratase
VTTRLHPTLQRVTDRIIERSAATRTAYLASIAAQRKSGTQRAGMGCANMAHTTAALPASDKLKIHAERAPHIGIVTAYNDMLSAHQPLRDVSRMDPRRPRSGCHAHRSPVACPPCATASRRAWPAWSCRLFSRDVIALSTAVALSHGVFDAALMLGVCDKIVPGLLIGALQFGHLPTVFVPAGPMTSGCPTTKKPKSASCTPPAVGREALLEAEAQAYHGPGTCTFYGTANSNQMLMEVMGLHLPAASFVQSEYTPARGTDPRPCCGGQHRSWRAAKSAWPMIVTEKAIVNGIVGLLATGGSTNHTLHLVAMARAAGISIDWSDFAELSHVVPLLARSTPTARRREPLPRRWRHGLPDSRTARRRLAARRRIHGHGPRPACLHQEPWLQEGQLGWRDAPAHSLDDLGVAPVRPSPSAPTAGCACCKATWAAAW